jgi:hypothetical protein
VHASVKFDRQTLFKTEEIHNATVNRDLAAELQPEALVPQ